MTTREEEIQNLRHALDVLIKSYNQRMDGIEHAKIETSNDGECLVLVDEVLNQVSYAVYLKDSDDLICRCIEPEIPKNFSIHENSKCKVCNKVVTGTIHYMLS